MKHHNNRYFLVFFTPSLLIISAYLCLLFNAPLISYPLIITAIFSIVPLLSYRSRRQHQRNMRNSKHNHYQSCTKLLYNITPWYKRMTTWLGFNPSPTYLIIGTCQAGKTQLLETATPILQHKSPCQIYHHGKNILLDTPGIDITTQATWLTPLLQALHYHGHTYPLQSILVIVDALHLDQAIVSELITLISTTIKKVPTKNTWPSIQIVVTKCDQMPQFIECFNPLTKQDKKAKFGLMFKEKNILHNPKQAFNRRFSQLTDHIEHYVETPDHPLLDHFQRLHAPLLKLTECISESSLYLRGIFFTSTRTEPALFVHDWLTQAHTRPIAYCQKNQLHTLTTCSALFLFMWISMNHTLQQNTQYLSQIEQQLQTTSIPENPILTTLNRLNNAKLAITNNPQPKDKLPQITQLETKLNATYQQILTHDFMQQLAGNLETALTQLSTQTIKDFSIYMMLCSNQKRDNKTLTQWFQDYWKKHSTPTEQVYYLNHLRHLLNQPSHCHPNHQLISKVQAYLNNIPIEDLIVSLTQSQIEIDLAKQSATRVTSTAGQIPIIYTYKYFQKVMKQGLKENYATLRQYQQQEFDLKVLEKSQQRYLETYKNSWQQALNNIHIPVFHTLSQAHDTLVKIRQGPKATVAQLAKIMANTYHPEDTYFSQNIGNYFNVKQHLSPQEIQAKLNQWLTQLQQFVDQMHSSKQANTTIVALTQKRMQTYPRDALSYLRQQANDFPPVIGTWLDQLINQTWQCMLQQTHSIINEQWASTIMPIYQSNINNRFPVKFDSKQDITIESFNNFFSPGGKLQAFMENYLAAFLDQEKGYWAWKKVDGRTLSNNKAALDMLMRAHLVQTMFFQNEKSTQAKSTWQLKPIKLASSLKSLEIHANDKTTTISEQNAKQTTIDVVIPIQTGKVAITFNNKNQLTTSQIYQGPWAWLRALQKATQQKTTNKGDEKNTITLQFSHQDDSIAFRATPPEAINPLSPGILEALELNDAL
jgi:type VI protein secretion system component VasK